MRLIPILDDNGVYLKDEYTDAEPVIPECYYQILNKFDEPIVNHPVIPVYIGDKMFSVSEIPFKTKCLIHGIANHGKLVYGDRHHRFTVGKYNEYVDAKLDILSLLKDDYVTMTSLNFRIKGYLQFYAGLHSNYISSLFTPSVDWRDTINLP